MCFSIINKPLFVCSDDVSSALFFCFNHYTDDVDDDASIKLFGQ